MYFIYEITVQHLLCQLTYLASISNLGEYLFFEAFVIPCLEPENEADPLNNILTWA